MALLRLNDTDGYINTDHIVRLSDKNADGNYYVIVVTDERHIIDRKTYDMLLNFFKVWDTPGK